MADQDLHLYFALRLTTLLPNQNDLTARLQTRDANLNLLLDLHPFNPAGVMNYMFMRLNMLQTVEVRRAYFWIQRFRTDPGLEYFMLQHPKAAEHTMPRALFDVSIAAYGGNFYYQVGQQYNMRMEEVERALEPLFNTFTILYDLNLAPWWEDMNALTRADIDKLVDYLRLAIR